MCTLEWRISVCTVFTSVPLFTRKDALGCDGGCESRTDVCHVPRESRAASSYDTSHFPTPSFSGTAQAPYLQPTITNPYVTLYSYDVLGNLTQVVQGSQTRTYQYDGLGRLTKEITPEAGTVTLSYVTSPNVLCSGNPSNRCSRTDARGITTTYVYDAANRLKQTTHSDSTGTVAYAYDTGSYGKGRLASVTEPSGSETYTYDQAGRIITVAKVIAGTTYTTSYAYNAGGELTKLTYPSGRVVQYSYDNVGQAESIFGKYQKPLLSRLG